ncbi:hypothetical protein Zmor_002607 [Zophobas morio]|uniref:Uncharacterized protein n=1 Tax=Zophobas morio TaxID=2755281 RepID=A0AA38MTR8_9CUCU|nr:hypothetical protein Zmor_002607 [Zophobas morio]
MADSDVLFTPLPRKPCVQSRHCTGIGSSSDSAQEQFLFHILLKFRIRRSFGYSCRSHAVLSFSRICISYFFVLVGKLKHNYVTMPADIPEILWFEEETELIRSCAALSSAVGLQKSFSTSDISQLPSPEDSSNVPGLRSAVSELALNSLQRSGFILENARLDHTSRSCSTWVAVGDIASTSQLPSPHGGQTSSTAQQQAGTPPPPPVFTAADFIRSVNKKVRQNYIRRRLLTTYKALERLSQSEFNLDRLEVAPAAATASVVNTETSTQNAGPVRLTVPGSSPSAKANPPPPNSTNAAVLRAAKQRASKNLPLTIRDVERERGKPLSKYERNMMIFNWLHTLDDTVYVEGIQ